MREAGDRTTWTDARRDLRGGRPRRRRRGVRRPRGARRCSTTSSTGSPAPGWSNAALRQAARADDARRARRLPGQRAVGAEPGRPRQPAPGRLRRAARRCSTGPRRRAARPHAAPPTTAATPSSSSPRPALTLRRSQPRPVHDVRARRAPRATRPTTLLAFDRGGALTVATRLPVGLAAARLGRHRAAPARGRWADLLSGREYAGAAPRARAAGRPPGRAADPGGGMSRSTPSRRLGPTGPSRVRLAVRPTSVAASSR